MATHRILRRSLRRRGRRWRSPPPPRTPRACACTRATLLAHNTVGAQPERARHRPRAVGRRPHRPLRRLRLRGDRHRPGLGRASRTSSSSTAGRRSASGHAVVMGDTTLVTRGPRRPAGRRRLLGPVVRRLRLRPRRQGDHDRAEVPGVRLQRHQPRPGRHQRHRRRVRRAPRHRQARADRLGRPGHRGGAGRPLLQRLLRRRRHGLHQVHPLRLGKVAPPRPAPGGATGAPAVSANGQHHRLLAQRRRLRQPRRRATASWPPAPSRRPTTGAATSPTRSTARSGRPSITGAADAAPRVRGDQPPGRPAADERHGAVDDRRRPLRVLRHRQHGRLERLRAVRAAARPADATQVAGSPHGNYAAYSCSSGALYLSYVGGR